MGFRMHVRRWELNLGLARIVFFQLRSTADRHLAPGVQSLSFLFNYSLPYRSKTVSSSSAFNCGKLSELLIEALPACVKLLLLLWMSVHAACTSALLCSCNACQKHMPDSKVTPSLLHQNHLVVAWRCTNQSACVTFSAAKSSFCSLHLFHLFLYLFITEEFMSNWRKQI